MGLYEKSKNELLNMEELKTFSINEVQLLQT